MKKLHQFAMVSVFAAMMTACATPSVVTKEGATNDPKWPKWDSTTFNKDRGTFPNLASLKEIRSGMTKDQLYYLIGRPHYDEVWRPREWNYLFHFNTPGVGTDGVTTCQYKVTFDKDMYARNFYWNPVDPIDGACPPAQQPANPVVAPVKGLQRYTLNADALFAFDKYRIEDMNAKGRAELDELAEKLKTFDQLNGVLIVGHTDRLGSDAYNLTLSQRRADTVSRYLIERGVPAGIVRGYGAGEREPVKECSDSLSHQELIKCLQPNRRVVVEVDGSGILLNTNEGQAEVVDKQ